MQDFELSIAEKMTIRFIYLDHSPTLPFIKRYQVIILTQSHQTIHEIKLTLGVETDVLKNFVQHQHFLCSSHDELVLSLSPTLLNLKINIQDAEYRQNTNLSVTLAPTQFDLIKQQLDQWAVTECVC